MVHTHTHRAQVKLLKHWNQADKKKTESYSWKEEEARAPIQNKKWRKIRNNINYRGYEIKLSHC